MVYNIHFCHWQRLYNCMLLLYIGIILAMLFSFFPSHPFDQHLLSTKISLETKT